MSLKNHDTLGRNVPEIRDKIPVDDNKLRNKNARTLSSRRSILTSGTSHHQSYEDHGYFLYSSGEAMVEPEMVWQSGKEISLHSPVHTILDSGEMSRRPSHFRSVS